MATAAVLFFFFPALPATWADAQETAQDTARTRTDTTLSGYQDRSVAGSPNSAAAQLAIDDQAKEPYFRVPDRVLLPWYNLKRGINDRYGLQFGLTYQAVWIGASAGITDSSQTSSASGVLNIPVVWTFAGKESGRRSMFTMILEGRHVFGGNEVSPMLLGFETGSALLPATKFNDVTFRVLVMHYAQILKKNRIGFLVGKIAPDDYFNFHAWVHPFKNFLGYANSVSPTVNWPNPGLGVGFGAFATEHVYFKVQVNDAQGDPYAAGDFLSFGNRFFDGQFFTVAEVGYVASYEERFFNRAGLTFWHADAYPGSEEGHGVALSANWKMGDHVIPFVLGGVSNGKGANVLAKATATVGAGYWFRSHDVVALSANWTRPPGSSLRDQYAVEAFLRFYLTQRIAVTPDVQWVFSPALNPAKSSIVYFGIRLRLDL